MIQDRLKDILSEKEKEMKPLEKMQVLGSQSEINKVLDKMNLRFSSNQIIKDLLDEKSPVEE